MYQLNHTHHPCISSVQLLIGVLQCWGGAGRGLGAGEWWGLGAGWVGLGVREWWGLAGMVVEWGGWLWGEVGTRCLVVVVVVVVGMVPGRGSQQGGLRSIMG